MIKWDERYREIYFVIEVLGQTEGAVLHLQHLYSPCKSQCFIGAQYQHAFGRRNFVFWTKFGTKKKGTNEAWEIQLIGWRGEMLRLYIWLRLHWGKYIEDKSWLCSSNIGELWRRVVPGSMVRYSPRCCACVNASTSFPGRNRSCSEFVTTAPVHHNALQHECPYTVYNKHSSGCPSLSAVAIIT